MRAAWVGVVLALAFGNAHAAGKIVVGVALPRAQLGQGNGANADVAEPVRQALIAYLKGPNGDDVLSPLIEAVAIAVVAKVTAK
jgi:hypothetical protein